MYQGKRAESAAARVACYDMKGKYVEALFA
jgi:hypothetical protein